MSMIKKKETQRIGKEGELKVIGKLLEEGFDVYLPIIDVKGIDCIIRTEDGYKEIQIKTREEAKKLLFDVNEFTPKENFFIICYNLKEPGTFWVIPSKVFKKYAYHIKKFGKFRLVLGEKDSEMRQKLQMYRDNFSQLKGSTKLKIKKRKRESSKKSKNFQKLGCAFLH